MTLQFRNANRNIFYVHLTNPKLFFQQNIVNKKDYYSYQ